MSAFPRVACSKPQHTEKQAPEDIEKVQLISALDLSNILGNQTSMLIEIKAGPLRADVLSEGVLLRGILGTETSDIIKEHGEAFAPDTVRD